MATAVSIGKHIISKKTCNYELVKYGARSLIEFYNSCITQVNQTRITENILKAMETYLLIRREPENKALVDSLRIYYQKCKDKYLKV